MSPLSEIFAQDLRGHEYIAARGLSPKSVTEQQPLCERCRLAEMEPVVQQIVENWNRAQ